MPNEPREMTQQEEEAGAHLLSLILDVLDKARGQGLPSAEITARAKDSFALLLNAVRAPLYEQSAEQRRHIEALEAKVQVLEARLP